MRSWPTQTRQRPSWWTPEKVLELLRSGEPAPVLCHRVSAELDGKVKPATLRADISRWTQTASVGDDFKAALALWKPDGVGGLELTDDWHDEFYAALAEADGEIELACEYACVGTELVYARLDKRGKHYDEAFADRVKLLEGRRMSRIRENVLKQAAMATADGGKLGIRVLESAMPSLHGAKSTVEVTGKVEVEHGLAREVVEASAARTKTLLAGREVKSLPEPTNVIDITPRARVKEAAR